MASPALDVYLHGSLVGALRRKRNGNLQFRYDGSYIEANGPPLSLHLPLRTEAFPHRDCLAFFPAGGGGSVDVRPDRALAAATSRAVTRPPARSASPWSVLSAQPVVPSFSRLVVATFERST